MTISQKNEVTLKGKSLLRVFERGAIKYWMEKKSPLVPQELRISRDLRTARSAVLRDAIEECVKRGLCVHEETVDNLVVTAGKELLCDLLAGEETVGMAYHEIGSGSTTPVIADTALTTCEKRKALTSLVRSGNQVLASAFYMASECTYDIQEAGIFGGAAATATEGSGKMLCHYLQAYDNAAGEYDLTFEYSLTID